MLKEAKLSRLLKHMIEGRLGFISPKITEDNLKLIKREKPEHAISTFEEALGRKLKGNTYEERISDIKPSELRQINLYLTNLLRRKARKGYIKVKGIYSYRGTRNIVVENPLAIVDPTLGHMKELASMCFQESFIYVDRGRAYFYIYKPNTGLKEYIIDDEAGIKSVPDEVKISAFDKGKSRKSGIKPIYNPYGNTIIKGKTFYITFYEDISPYQSAILERLAKVKDQTIDRYSEHTIEEENTTYYPQAGSFPIRIENNRVVVVEGITRKRVVRYRVLAPEEVLK